jgi:hypothetical protein
MELCKKITFCNKKDKNQLLLIIDIAIRTVLNSFCGLIDNRTYMIITNRLVPLIDLLNYCLGFPTKVVYSLGFVPTVFQILTRHIKHKMNRNDLDYVSLKEETIEYIFCCGML